MNEDPSELTPEEVARAERIAYLVATFVRKDITPEETAELDEWVGESDHNVLLFEEMTDEKTLAQMMAVILGVNPDDAIERVNQKIAFNASQQKKRVRRMLTYAVAVLLIGVIIVIDLNKSRRNDFPIAKSKPVQYDIAPGGNKAMLTLSDGKKIILGDEKKGAIAQQGIAFISKTEDGQIVYRLDEKQTLPEGELAPMNIIETPRGGQYQLTLSDGTKVWLNAASSIKYPASFSENERTVEITGEAYFEIAHKTDPSSGLRVGFKVKTKREIIEDLGTHFNINAYEDENEIRTTLLEGSLKVIAQNNSVLVRPGEQAKLDSTGRFSVVKGIRMEDVIGWKSGMFSFYGQDIKSIMRQVQRWYDVDVEYKGTTEKHFTGTIDRNVPVSKLLNYLENTEDMHFSLENKTIIVNP